MSAYFTGIDYRTRSFNIFKTFSKHDDDDVKLKANNFFHADALSVNMQILLLAGLWLENVVGEKNVFTFM